MPDSRHFVLFALSVAALAAPAPLAAAPAAAIVVAEAAAGTPAAEAADTRIELERLEDRVVVTLDGKPFTEFLFRKEGKHGPVLFPLLGPGGVPLTRSWPVGPLVQGEPQDHPHHESFWCNHGDVNGHDFWTGRGGTRIELEQVDHAGDGTIRVRCRWLAPDGSVVCTDRRKIVFAAEGDDRIIDHTITIMASHGPLVFGDTKEGTMAVRVRPELNTKQAKNGPAATGHYLNANGERDADAWGKPAAWVDLSGTLDGKSVGITCFDHPRNLRHPSMWHARDYGLFAANPFGLHDFTGAAEGSGRVTLAPGQTLTLEHRWILHAGDAAAARVAERYADWVSVESEACDR